MIAARGFGCDQAGTVICIPGAEEKLRALASFVDDGHDAQRPGDACFRLPCVTPLEHGRSLNREHRRSLFMMTTGLDMEHQRVRGMALGDFYVRP